MLSFCFNNKFSFDITHNHDIMMNMISVKMKMSKKFTVIVLLSIRSSSSQKEMWWDKLTALIKQERRANPSSTNIQLGYFEQSTNFEHVRFSSLVLVKFDWWMVVLLII